ncbi:MAG: 3-hydroxyacyl-CoA dehydrogenase NAD-binding domain-containing protein [Candidatus Eremiobacteraeota bacterium]|nr:3-hydroxyacyl-CoA dehydrogenase NAD-binding domain-containing protein [Candidatus Eremiobacteraeota bacterium]
MGGGIAQVAAQSGDTVVLLDRDASYVARGVAAIANNLSRSVEKGRLSADDRNAALARIVPAADWRDFEVDVAIEAATENEALKSEIFGRLDVHTPARAILASNTSSISITKLAAATRRPERVIGMHYMNPVPVMQLVEVIRGIATSRETFDTVRALALQHGKTPVEVRNYPGFVSNRILCPMLNEAAFALFEGVGTVESIDTVMKLGMNHPMGPLELADFIGLDTLVAILDVLLTGTGDPKYRACPLLREYVAAGWLGRKSGLGFYDWSGGTRARRADLGASGVPDFSAH